MLTSNVIPFTSKQTKNSVDFDRLDHDSNVGTHPVHLSLISSGKHNSQVVVSWAKHYYPLIKTTYPSQATILPEIRFEDLTIMDGSRIKAVYKLQDSLSDGSAKAWEKVSQILGKDTEKLLGNVDLLDPWQIITESRQIYTEVIEAFAEYESPAKLSVLVGRDLVQLRRRYSETNPLLLGFVSMQFYYLGQNLLGSLAPEERTFFVPYLKIIDDYLSLPIGEIHDLAGDYPSGAPELVVVQHLLQESTNIAYTVFEQVSAMNPGYHSYTSRLTNILVQLASIRDVEIFINYLCYCILEGSSRPIEQELFPLCAMLYPRLKVSSKLIQDMLLVVFGELCDRLSDKDLQMCLPYFYTMSEMFVDELVAA